MEGHVLGRGFQLVTVLFCLGSKSTVTFFIGFQNAVTQDPLCKTFEKKKNQPNICKPLTKLGVRLFKSLGLRFQSISILAKLSLVADPFKAHPLVRKLV